MVFVPVARTRHRSRAASVVLVLFCLIGAACSTADRNAKILFEDPRGTVSLQSMPDQSIQATHPIGLDPLLIAQILKGIEIQDQERGLQKLLIGPPPPVPVFSDDQIQFLAPLLAEGLRTATPDQRIGYRVETTHKGSFLESSTTETTTGSLYAYGRQLYVILSQYRYSPTQANLNIGDMANRSRLPSTIQASETVYSHLRPASLSDPTPSICRTGEKPTDRFLAIDYQLLQQAPAAASVGRAAPQMDRTSPTRESPTGTSASEVSTPSTEALAQEVEALKKEMRSLQQQQLGNQPTKQDSLKRKAIPRQK